jgi:predicted TIM-barrel fold metal-dependent hydrolase
LIIDIHTHCFPDELAGRAVSLLAETAGIEAYTDGTVHDLKGSMRDADIGISVIQPIATKPSQVRTINDWARRIQDEEIMSFGTLHPDYGDWKEEIKRLVEMEFKGIKLHPDYQDFYIDEERMFPIYDTLFSYGLVILFHSGVDIGLEPPYHCRPDRLRKLVRMFPGGKVIAAHMGSFLCWDEVFELLVGEDIYFDTSYSLHRMGEERMVQLIRAHGASRILFGTDSPWSSQAGDVESFLSLPLSQDEQEMILSGNARELVGIKG